MKSTIILLATIAGIGIATSQASASDAQNLSCITEIADNGTTVRDCGLEPRIIARKAEKVEVRHMPTPIAPDRGGKGGFGNGGNTGGGANNGGGNSPNN